MIFPFRHPGLDPKESTSKPHCVELNLQFLMKELRLLGSMLYTDIIPFARIHVFLRQEKHTRTKNPNKPPFQGFTEAHRKEGIPWNP